MEVVDQSYIRMIWVLTQIHNHPFIVDEVVFLLGVFKLCGLKLCDAYFVEMMCLLGLFLAVIALFCSRGYGINLNLSFRLNLCLNRFFLYNLQRFCLLSLRFKTFLQLHFGLYIFIYWSIFGGKFLQL